MPTLYGDLPHDLPWNCERGFCTYANEFAASHTIAYIRQIPNTGDIDQLLHAADADRLEQRIMELALGGTRARHGALFLWDAEREGLTIACQYVEGIVIPSPGTLLRHRKDGRANGIALWAFDNAKAYACHDTASDPNYTRYFQDVGSVLAVPCLYQGKPFAVISVAALEPGAFTDADLSVLEELARSSSKFLRRAQLSRSKRGARRRPFLIKGLSPEWLEVESQIERVAATDIAVLVLGESGTGKELVANAIHFNSARSTRAFVAVNCAAIPDALLESTLFGHVRGAFTGAVSDRVGEMQRADGGTLFLDEVGELPLALQAKLLRALEEGEIQPLGSGKEPVRVDVRVLCATNRDLEAMVRTGTFREDLYHRLSVVSVELPALRTYKDNLEVLALVALQQAAERHKKNVTRISKEAMAVLRAHDFPGNVRELNNAMERGVVLATSDEIQPADLPPAMTRGAPAHALAAGATETDKTLRELREEWLAPLERRYVTELLSQCDGDVRRAAVRAGVNMVTMYRLMKRRGIRVRKIVE